MAKPVFSSTLKNLKFMQRAAQREEMMLKKDVKPEGNFTSHVSVTRKCVVIMDSDPHPGVVNGRMSFQNFNPSIDKVNEEASRSHQSPVPAMSADTGKVKESYRENGSSTDQGECSKMDVAKPEANGDHMRKQSEVVCESQDLKNSPKRYHSNQQSPASKRNGFKKPKGNNLDWNLLRRSRS